MNSSAPGSVSGYWGLHSPWPRGGGKWDSEPQSPIVWGIQRGALRSLGPANTGIGPARMQASFSEYLPPRSGRWTFLCLCHGTCACMCMKPPYTRVRGQVLSDWPGVEGGVDLQQQEGILGESMGESACAPRKGALHFHPSLPSSPQSLLGAGELWGMD